MWLQSLPHFLFAYRNKNEEFITYKEGVTAVASSNPSVYQNLIKN